VTIPEYITIAHGAGGRLTHELIEQMFVPALDNVYLRPLSDAAVMPEVPPGRPAMTTDAFVVDPPVFAGGDLGYLSVCGTVNDLAVAGAKPLWLTWALILEEGIETTLLETLVAGAARAARESHVQIVAGDTKVVPCGKCDRAFVVTTGFGIVPHDRDLTDEHVSPGDVVVASGPLGDHGATIMGARHGISSETLRSDCAPLTSLVQAAWSTGALIRCMHDPTRGGLATVCHEVAGRAKARITLEESMIPIRAEVAATCGLLGIDPLYLACEGRVLFWAHRDDASKLLSGLRQHELGREAAVIGRVDALDAHGVPVVLNTRIGGTRPLDLLSGGSFPRIC
jgi:hydrogenase expression/formation protein HypE